MFQLRGTLTVHSFTVCQSIFPGEVAGRNPLSKCNLRQVVHLHWWTGCYSSLGRSTQGQVSWYQGSFNEKMFSINLVNHCVVRARGSPQKAWILSDHCSGTLVAINQGGIWEQKPFTYSGYAKPIWHKFMGTIHHCPDPWNITTVRCTLPCNQHASIFAYSSQTNKTTMVIWAFSFAAPVPKLCFAEIQIFLMKWKFTGVKNYIGDKTHTIWGSHR